MKRDNEKQDNLAKITKFMLDVMFYGGIVTCITLPLLIAAIAPYYDKFELFYWQAVILYFADGILAVMLINELRKIFRTVLDDDCFLVKNVDSLRKMGNYSFAIMAVSAVRLFFYITPASLKMI